MRDLGQKMTDDRMDEIKKKLIRLYSEAAKDLKKKAEEHTKKFKEKDAKKRALRDSGKISEAEYKRWQSGQVFIGNQWKSKVEQMAKSLVHVEEAAVDIINGEQINCFADNTNYMEFKIDKDHGFGMNFSLYDEHTVAMLVAEEPELLRRRYVNGRKCEAWNVKIINNCVSQGIIQGESIPQIANRIARDTAFTDMKAVTRYARTAMTCAQNAGRIRGMQESIKRGLLVQKEWIAVDDGLTRDAHLDLDGQIVDVDQPFKSILGDIYYPGDPDAADANIWNCRCSIGFYYPKVETPEIYEEEDEDEDDEYDEEDEFEQWELDHDLNLFGDEDEDDFEEWDYEESESEEVTRSEETEEESVEDEETADNEETVVEGKDISKTWRWDKDKYSYEIDDITHAQGFDGLPAVVDQETFDKAVKESSFIAQRQYSAESEELLGAYKEMLYYGKWYIDCTHGGYQYGKGMYCASDYTGTLTDGIKKEMEHYKELWRRRNQPFSTVETITLVKDPKIITYDDAFKLSYDFKENYVSNLILEDIKDLPEDEKMIWARETRTILPDISSLTVIHRAREIRKKIGDKEYNRISEEALQKNQEYQQIYEENIADLDVGSVAALYGYDAIKVEGHGQSGSYTVILNRTKCVFLEGRDYGNED